MGASFQFLKFRPRAKTQCGICRRRGDLPSPRCVFRRAATAHTFLHTSIFRRFSDFPIFRRKTNFSGVLISHEGLKKKRIPGLIDRLSVHQSYIVDRPRLKKTKNENRRFPTFRFSDFRQNTIFRIFKFLMRASRKNASRAW